MTIPNRERLRAAALVAVLLSFATASPAQLRPDAAVSIPTDVVAALLTASSVTPGAPQLFVGTVPRSFEGVVLVPKNARVLGSAVYANSIVAALTMPGTEDNVRQELGRGLAAAGWKAPATRNAYQAFRYAISPTSPFNELALCRDGDMLVTRVERRDLTSSTITESAWLGQPAYPCSAAPQPPSTQPVPTLPLLTHPPGSGEQSANMNACGPAARAGDSPIFPRLDYIRSTQSVDALVAHYGRQLQDSGWTAVKPGPAVARASWTHRDSTGTLYEATLTAESGLRPGCVQVGVLVGKAHTP
jgi:hypothetical protein